MRVDLGRAGVGEDPFPGRASRDRARLPRPPPTPPPRAEQRWASGADPLTNPDCHLRELAGEDADFCPMYRRNGMAQQRAA